MEETKNSYKILAGKPEGKRPLRRTIRIWEDSIRMDLMETGRGSVDWINVAQDRGQWQDLVNTVINSRIP
jgi:hypothetical protein